MSVKKKSDKPAVTTYADHEVILPTNNLRHAAKVAGPKDMDDDPIARAEAALAELSSEFAGWMDTECERLDTARRTVKQMGFNKKTHEALFHAAHDIKGEAATFGFPMVGVVAESLCRLIEHTPEITSIPLPLIDQHVDAVRAIVRESGKPNAEKIAARLSGELRQVADAFLLEANRHRLDDMDGILAPPLVPGDSGN